MILKPEQVAFSMQNVVFPDVALGDVYGTKGPTGCNYGRRLPWDGDVPMTPSGVEARVEECRGGTYLQIQGTSHPSEWEQLHAKIETLAVSVGAPSRASVEWHSLAESKDDLPIGRSGRE
ncbi:MAG: hypothetical protein QF486_03395 [Candidatus Woesearchaeota archaeon]|jgi:hypothetical protein|nr:hypothetical protein [Candidatus Woesearchaeota archaeon]MDP7181599.1 hypothetical protein [Candidatus Woesearchaeota archaeon]MDP7198641.1 hypothetical protein [Candidatus Woesearchaeota archaeon]MDP7466617.1 hypothetical protein [Candidatus Woesearchaeota archaeon]MDP7646873.1 hypothetical protein [Candidatus Woesearchaeota archaeon]|tara:strand:+ start:309 stop:668 length:360 start_codon:yes stop_codon:yes gene_type:complete